jgi:CHAT domain-containing protein
MKALALLVLLALQSPEARERLEAGSAPVEAEIAGGAEHVYEVAARAGDYVRLIVVPAGADLDVTAERDGVALRQVGGIESQSRTVSWLAEDGAHRLHVKARGAADRRGRYRVEVSALRPASDGDPDRVAADTLLGESQTLRREGSKAKLGEAMDRAAEALTVFERLGDTTGQADALNALSEMSYGLGELPAALGYVERELPLRRAARDAEGEGTALNNLGVVNRTLGQARLAIEAYEQGLVLRRAAGDVRGEAQTLSNIGVAYAMLDEYQQAAEYLQAALPLRRAAKDRRGEGHTLHSLGGFYFALGDFEKALEYAVQALAIRREIGDRAGEAQTFQAMGQTWAELGQPEKAREHLDRAVELRRATGDKLGEGNALYNIGEAYTTSDPTRALGYFEQALPLHRATRDRRGEGNTLHEMGEALVRLGELEAADARFAEALAIRRETADRAGEADTLFAMGRALRQRGDLDGARRLMEQSLDIVDSLRIKVSRLDLRQSFVGHRLRQYEEHVELLMDIHRQRPESAAASAAFAAAEHARARSLRDILQESGADVRQGLSPELAARLQRAREALNARERERLRLLGTPAPDEVRHAAGRAVEAALTEYREAEGEARRSNPRLLAMTQPAALSAAELQALLDEDTVLLEYALGPRRSHVFVVTRDTLVAYELPARPAIEEMARRYRERAAASGLREAQVAARAAGRALSDALLAPLGAALRGQRLVVVPDGALHAVPFAALPAPATGEPLLLAHEVVQLPSLSVLATLRTEAPAKAEALYAVLADPVLDVTDDRLARSVRAPRVVAAASEASPLARAVDDAGGQPLQRLPWTRREAEAIRDLAGRGHTRLAMGWEASRANVLGGLLRGATVVHFATHGFLNGRHPELSGLVLSLVDEQGRPQEGFLRLHDVYNLELDAGLVVLSACRTALGRDVPGEGVVGLTRGFMFAGAPRVVASLWDVRDESSSELMKRFYTGLVRKRLRPAAALREAQRSMLAEPRYAAPVHWAGFVLQGDWR